MKSQRSCVALSKIWLTQSVIHYSTSQNVKIVFKFFFYCFSIHPSHTTKISLPQIVFDLVSNPLMKKNFFFFWGKSLFYNNRGILQGNISESYTSILRPRSRRGEYVEYVPLPPVRKRSLFFNSRLSSGVNCFRGSVLSLKKKDTIFLVSIIQTKISFGTVNVLFWAIRFP